MLRLTDPQESLWWYLLPEEVRTLPEHLASADALLDDERFFEPFLEQFNTKVGIVPMSGARVAVLTSGDIKEIGEARVALETFAARLIAAAATVVDLLEVERSLKRLARAVRGRRWGEIVDADVRFHRSVIAATRNGRLLRFWQDLEGQVRLYLSYHAEEAYDLHRIVDAHKELLDSLRSGDPYYTVELFRIHIEERTSRRQEFWEEAGHDHF